MERKIGEIFEYNGEWYQCVEQPEKYDKTVCALCAFQGNGNCELDMCSGTYRSDKKSVVFKKLEKVGEPREYFIQGMGIIMIQEYILANANYIWEYSPNVVVRDWQNGRVAIEVKQTKEDMEEKKSNLKPFDLEAAKAGKPVCTRDGRKARVLCYDFKQNEEYPILVAVENKDGKECALLYSNYGISEMYKSSNNELAILLEKKEGWVNVYKECDGEYYVEKVVYKIKGHAVENASSQNYVGTVRIEFYESKGCDTRV